MHNDNTKDYWRSYYSSITEGAVKGLLNDMGYFMRDDGKWEHETSKEVLSDEEAQQKASRVHNRRNPLNPYQRARERSAKNDPEKRLSMKRAARRREQKQESKNESFDLFPKSDERLLREHIRAEYEARGIYPTAREVQETYNQVMDLIEKRKTPQQADASLMLRQGASSKQVKDTIGKKTTPEGKSGNALLRRALSNAEYQGMMQGHITDDNDQPLLPRIEAHKDRRGVPTKISPSSPARKQSKVEKDTRFLMGQGFSPDHLRRIMSDSGR